MLRRFTDTPLAVVNVLFNIVAILLSMRFVFRLLAANAQHWLTVVLYALTDPLVLPFRGLFRSVAVGGGTIEWSSVVALLVYAGLTVLLLRILMTIADETEQQEAHHPAHSRHHGHA